MRIPETTYDGALGLYSCFIRMPRRDSVFLRLLLESYEGVAVVRSVDPDPDLGGPSELQVLLVVKDAKADVEAVLTEVARDIPIVFVQPDAAIEDHMREALLGELGD